VWNGKISYALGNSQILKRNLDTFFLLKKNSKRSSKKIQTNRGTRDSTGLASALSPYADYAQNFPKLKKRFKD